MLWGIACIVKHQNTIYWTMIMKRFSSLNEFYHSNWFPIFIEAFFNSHLVEESYLWDIADFDWFIFCWLYIFGNVVFVSVSVLFKISFLGHHLLLLIIRIDFNSLNLTLDYGVFLQTKDCSALRIRSLTILIFWPVDLLLSIL